MPHRIEVELTSVRPDGTWTWRAAGAREPRGVLPGSLLYEGAKVGDVVRAEAEFEVDGITLLAVLPPRPPRAEPERIEILGPPRAETALVTGAVGGARGRGPASDERAPRDGRGEARRAAPRAGLHEPRRSGGAASEGRGVRAPGQRAPLRPSTGEPAHRVRAGEEAPDLGAGGPREREARAPRGARRGPIPPSGPVREAGPARRVEAAGQARGARGEGRGRAPAGAEDGGAERRRRVPVRRAHQAALLSSLSPEERPVAEQLLRGGLAAVRQALEARNAEARAAGLPEVHPGPLLAMAEALYPRVKAAVWRDRAEAAATMLDEVPLRDLRALVAGAEGSLRDDESRLLAARLREALERRVAALRERWLGEVARALDEGEALRALRLSARPPDLRTRFPAELAVRLAAAAGEAMAPETPADRWLAVLEAVLASPVRRSVRPVGLPKDAGRDVLAAARQAAGRVPALAGLLGIDMPPPPGPPRRPEPSPARSGAGVRAAFPAASAPGPPAPVEPSSAAGQPEGDGPALPSTPVPTG